LRKKMHTGVTRIGLLLIALTYLLRAEAAPEEKSESPDANDAKVGTDVEQGSSQQHNLDDTRIGVLDAEQLGQLALSDEVRPHEVLWLEVEYPQQENTVNVLALEQKPRLTPTRGAILLLHDKEQHANWPYLIRSLRQGLPDSGWYTLSLNLPYDDFTVVSERTLATKSSEQIVLNDALKQALMKPASRVDAVAEDTEEGDIDKVNTEEVSANETETPSVTPDTNPSQEGIDIDLAEKGKHNPQRLSYRERAKHHIQAAMDHLRNQGYQNIVVIAYRAGADLALDHIKPIAQQISRQGFALVMIDPILQYGYQSDIGQALGQNFSAPILDIVNGGDLDSRVFAVERENTARMTNASGYQQARLIANESGAFQQSLLRRVRFWLEKYAQDTSATKVSTRR